MLKTLLNADVVEYRQEMIEEAEYEYFCRRYPRIAKLQQTYRRYKYHVVLWTNVHVLCPILGHETKSCTFFTEEKGLEHWWCERCGQQGHNRLY